MQEMTKEERRNLKRIRKKEKRESEQKEKQQKNLRKNLFILSIVGVVLISAAYLYIWQSQLPGIYDDFAQCLNENDFIMAGTDWCSTCITQKSLFGKSFEFVNYKNCDTDKDWCDSNGISRYPTWVLPDGGKRSGVMELQTLSQLSGCALQ